ncbi:unnamed protein product [Boreogadus saida]
MLSSRVVRTKCFLARMDLRWSTQQNRRCRILFQAGNPVESRDVPLRDSSTELRAADPVESRDVPPRYSSTELSFLNSASVGVHLHEEIWITHTAKPFICNK